jgi:hypothetical protein
MSDFTFLVELTPKGRHETGVSTVAGETGHGGGTVGVGGARDRDGESGVALGIGLARDVGRPGVTLGASTPGRMSHWLTQRIVPTHSPHATNVQTLSVDASLLIGAV